MITCFDWVKYERERRRHIKYYSRFMRWSVSTGSRAFNIVCSSNALIRFSNDQAFSKQEIYVLSHVEEHAFMVNVILRSLTPSMLFVEHGWPEIPWSFESGQSWRSQQRRQLLQEEVREVRLKGFTGGLVLTPPYVAFINAFIDYPLLEKRQCLLLFGYVERVPLVIRLNHHLSVDFISTDECLLDQIRALLKSLGLRQRQDFPTVFCRADQTRWA